MHVCVCVSANICVYMLLYLKLLSMRRVSDFIVSMEILL